MIVYPDDYKAQEVQCWGKLLDVIVKSEADSDYYIPTNGLAAYVRVRGFSKFDSNEFIIVGFSGAVKNKGLESGPFFSFSGISSSIGLPLISFSDPSLMLDSNLTLGWYLGNKYIPDYVERIAGLLDSISRETGKRLILAGGSGGGFAALNIANKMHQKDRALALVWNPQVVISNYYKTAVDRYIEASWDAVDAENIRGKKVVSTGVKSIFLMDGLDHSHLRLHLREYLKDEMPLRLKNDYYIYQDSAVIVGDWGTGHTAPPKEIILHHFNEVINNWDDFSAYPKLKMRKKVVDFSVEGFSKTFKVDIKPLVSIVSKNFMVELEVNKKYIGYQLRYEILDGSRDKIMSSPWLKNYHNCRAFGVLPKNIDRDDFNSWEVKVVVEDFSGKRLSVYYPVNKNIKKYYYMKSH